MRLICAWCEHEGGPSTVRETGPADELTVGYGICDAHSARLVAQLHKYYPPRRPAEDFPEALSA